MIVYNQRITNFESAISKVSFQKCRFKSVDSKVSFRKCHFESSMPVVQCRYYNIGNAYSISGLFYNKVKLQKQAHLDSIMFSNKNVPGGEIPMDVVHFLNVSHSLSYFCRHLYKLGQP